MPKRCYSSRHYKTNPAAEPSLLLEEAAGRVPDNHLPTPNVFRGRLCGPRTVCSRVETVIRVTGFEADYAGRHSVRDRSFQRRRVAHMWAVAIATCHLFDAPGGCR